MAQLHCAGDLPPWTRERRREDRNVTPGTRPLSDLAPCTSVQGKRIQGGVYARMLVISRPSGACHRPRCPGGCLSMRPRWADHLQRHPCSSDAKPMALNVYTPRVWWSRQPTRPGDRGKSLANGPETTCQAEALRTETRPKAEDEQRDDPDHGEQGKILQCSAEMQSVTTRYQKRLESPGTRSSLPYPGKINTPCFRDRKYTEAAMSSRVHTCRISKTHTLGRLFLTPESQIAAISRSPPPPISLCPYKTH